MKWKQFFAEQVLAKIEPGKQQQAGNEQYRRVMYADLQTEEEGGNGQGRGMRYDS